MARKRTVGFENQTLTAGVEIDTSSGTVSISSTQAHSGTRSLRSNPTTSNGYVGIKALSALNSGKIYLRFYLYIVTAPSAESSIAVFWASSVPDWGGDLRLTNSRTLTYYDFNDTLELTSSALSANTWHRVELYQDHANGAMGFKVDGTNVGDVTGVTLIDVDGVALGIGANVAGGGTNSTTGDIYIDDIAINDTTGTKQTGYPGDEKLLYLRPNAAGDVNGFTTQTGGTAGSANNYTRVDEITPDDATTFNGDNTLNHEDLYNFDASGLTSGDTINVVEVGARFRNNTADATTAAKIEIEKTASGTKTQSSAIVPNSTTWKTNATSGPLISPLITYTDPDGAAWTNTTLDSLQAGMIISTGGTNRIDISTLWVIVSYTPGAAPSTTASIGYRNLLGVGI